MNLPLGTDVSFNQKRMDWRAARAAGVLYAGIRLGQGGDWKDPRAKENWAGAKAAGVKRIAYHVWDERRGAGADAHFANLLDIFADVGNGLGDLGVLSPDLEVGPVTWGELERFFKLIKGELGMAPLPYSGAWFYDWVKPIPAWLGEYEHWLTGYNDTGPDVWGAIAGINPRVVIWQQSSGWQVPWAESGRVDRDYWWAGAQDYLRRAMAGKVVKVEDVVVFLEANAFDCAEPPAPPPPPGGQLVMVSPLPEPLAQHHISQQFNNWDSAYVSIGGHDGIDWAVVVGTPVFATHSGLVTNAGYRPGRDSDPYGDHVRIEIDALDHADGSRRYTSLYAHLSRLDVAVGQVVSAGQQIGLSGGVGSRRGNSSGPHLHFGIICQGAFGRGDTFLSGDFMDPLLWLAPALGLPPVAVQLLQVRECLTSLRIRNKPTVDGSQTRRIMSPGARFNVYEERAGWGAQDVSRTGWSSLNSAYSKRIGP